LSADLGRRAAGELHHARGLSDRSLTERDSGPPGGHLTCLFEVVLKRREGRRRPLHFTGPLKKTNGGSLSGDTRIVANRGPIQGFRRPHEPEPSAAERGYLRSLENFGNLTVASTAGRLPHRR